MISILQTTKRIIPRSLYRLLQGPYHFLFSFVAAVYYGFPSRRLIVVGVTGTNGKTTVVHLLHEVFSAAGIRTGSVSSLRFKIREREEKNILKMTMPGRFYLQRFLRECRRAGCKYVFVEVTSQGIQQSRHRFIRFRGAVLTNITPEHLESHGGFASYRDAKLKLFAALSPNGSAILNQNDPSSALAAERTRAQAFWYSSTQIVTSERTYSISVDRADADGIVLRIGDVTLVFNLGGEFNVMNILAASTTALAFGLPLGAIERAGKVFPGVPGRLEYIRRKPFSVVVDYAHTPDALERVYAALGTNLICVLGSAGGGRDRWKRPEMARIAADACREIIFTSEDPDDEDPAGIVQEMRAGIPAEANVLLKTILDRREAIKTALGDAKAGDTVIITGMGAQPWLLLRDGKVRWDERMVAQEELTRMSL